MSDKKSNIGSVNLSGISDSQVSVGDIKTTITAGGNIVGGDQIITHVYEAPPPPLPPAEARERRDLGISLGKVKQFWIEGVLEKSVHTIALIDLGKETQAEAVAHAWEQVLELPDQSRQTLPPDKKISHIFDEMNRALLILGAPGSGKTITLLQLARDLISQAEQDEIFSQPVPVVFNLSTWSEGQPLVDWLVAELSAKYQIPKRIGRPWLENHRLLPLLDGLDEVKADDRAACVEAINHFGEEFGLSGLVVCSRLKEYTRLPARLKLNGAIRLQPLTFEQVYDYLEAADSKLDALLLRAALQEDEGLQTLAQTPLTLGIMTLAYQDMPEEVLAGEVHDTVETRRKHLLDTYLERMFKRKGQSGKLHPDDQTQDWLSWLAQGMIRHTQSIFLIEQLQPSWLPNRTWRWVYVLSSRLLGGLAGMLIFWLGYGQIFGLVRGVSNYWPSFGLADGLLTGLSIGLGVGLFVATVPSYGIRDVQVQFWRSGEPIVEPVLIGLSYGLISGLLTALWYGGFDIIQHYTLRLILWYKGHTPRNYAHFLDYAAERIFLQKVGGGYIFIHRLLLEHFAGLGSGESESLKSEIRNRKSV